MYRLDHFLRKSGNFPICQFTNPTKRRCIEVGGWRLAGHEKSSDRLLRSMVSAAFDVLWDNEELHVLMLHWNFTHQCGFRQRRLVHKGNENSRPFGLLKPANISFSNCHSNEIFRPHENYMFMHVQFLKSLAAFMGQGVASLSWLYPPDTPDNLIPRLCFPQTKTLGWSNPSQGGYPQEWWGNTNKSRPSLRQPAEYGFCSCI